MQTRFCSCPNGLASTLELNIRKNQLVEKSCKSCGGRFSVDGIGPVSLTASMLSTVGLEVTNSISPELSWKSVTKGRRSRKPVPRNVNELAKFSNRSPKRVGDFSVSDSDKLDESAAGHRHSDKANYKPLKKRRHLLLSPPLPQSSSLHIEESPSSQPQTPSPHADNWHSDSYMKQVKGFGRSSGVKYEDCLNDDSTPDIIERELYNPDDFSGIALLAAAACIDGMDDEPDDVKKDILMGKLPVPKKADSSTSTKLIRECSTRLESKNAHQKEVVMENDMKSSTIDSSISLSQNLQQNDGTVKKKSVATKVDRLHWDLNVVMDAWEQPFDDSVDEDPLKDVTANGIKIEKLESEGCGKSITSEVNQCDAIYLMPLNQTEERKSELAIRNDKDMGVMNLDEKPAKSMNTPFPDIQNANQVASKISSNLSSPAVESHLESGVSVYKDVGVSTSERISILEEGARKLNESMSSLHARDGIETTGPQDFVSECSANEGFFNSRVADISGKTYELPYDCGTNLQEVDQCHLSSKCDDLFASGASSHSVCKPDVLGDRVSDAHASVTKSQELVAPMEAARKSDDHYLSKEGEVNHCLLPDLSKKDDGTQSDDPTSCSGKIGSTLDDSHNSGVSQDDHDNMVASKDTTELQAGYDSPYEDGELRVSMSCPWEANEIEDGEDECVDYESDCREGVVSDGADYPGSEIVEAGSEGSQGVEKRRLLVREASVSDFNKSGSLRSSSRVHYIKDDSGKIQSVGVKSTAGSGKIIEEFELTDDSARRRHIANRLDVVDMKESGLEESNSRINRGKLQSRIESLTTLDVTDRNNTDYFQQSRSRFHSRPIRDISPGKYMGRHRSTFHVRDGIGGDDGQWGYWDSRTRFPSSYPVPDGHNYTRHRSMVADSADKFDGLNSQDYRQSLNYSSKGPNRMIGRRLPYDRDDYCSGHRRMSEARDTSFNRNRGRSGNYHQGVGRGLREEYHEPLHENRAVSSGRMPRYMSRRERSFSPSCGKVPQNSLPRRKSRSRSRSRSPHPWHPRERNQGLRRHSRSPDVRYEAKFERVRMPLSKPGFPADYQGHILSPTRGRMSPQRNSGWTDDHDYAENYLRQRRSPVRMIRRGQRFDSLGSPRFKGDDYFRPAMRPARFPPVAGAGRGCKFQDNFDDRRRDERIDMLQRTRHPDAGIAAVRDDRAEMVNRTRHSDTSVAAGRLRHNAEDKLDANNSQNDDEVRGTDRRDVPRSCREDKRSFKV